MASPDTIATLLLHGRFGGETFERGEGPLSLGEYNAVMLVLVEQGIRPSDLVDSGDDVLGEVADAASGDGISADRLRKLLGRGMSLAVRLAEWESAGVAVIGRSDEKYPVCWSDRLRAKRPPVLYCVGDLSLMDGHSIGVVGSRDVDDEGRGFAESVSAAAVRDGFGVVSGFARGVDQYAMSAAIEAGGVTIGVLSEGLLRAASKSGCRGAIEAGRMALVATCSPDITRFQAWRAMDRNKLVYACAVSTVVVESASGSGGTWSGAKEAMEAENGIVLVRVGGGPSPGRQRLLEMGGYPLAVEALSLPEWHAPSGPPSGKQQELFG
jgi:predicted Rossmann fold nucleotide-binding protein DprA/Smf involved in DNA uptake